MENNIQYLKKILAASTYTVAICGSGMMEEGGFIGVKDSDRAYDIEKKYGVSPEEIFTSAYYSTRPEKFFDFYRNEMLLIQPEVTESSYVLAAMEAAGKLQCVITSNIYELSQRGGCRNVINLHGSIFNNICPHCKKTYSVDYIKNSQKVPLCEECGAVVRPGVSLFGEMVDNNIMTRTVEEIAKADVLLLLGTTLESEVYKKYIRYYEGGNLVLIHKDSHYSDERADVVILDRPMNVLTKLGYK